MFLTQRTKPLVIPLAMAILSVGSTACGGAGAGADPTTSAHSSNVTTKSATTVTNSRQASNKVDADKDNDIEAPYDDTNNVGALPYRHTASAVDRRAVAALVRRYYRTAVAEDGAKACSMIERSLAAAIVEDYGHGSAGPPFMRSGTTCPATMALLFKHEHAQLTSELPLLGVTHVLLAGRRGVAVLRFGTMPEREITVVREGHVWRIAVLLDRELP
jgi:hypothetical protein